MSQLFADLGDPLTLARCRELQELKLDASRPTVAELNLISTITSTSIQRIIFNRSFVLQEIPAPDLPDWTRLDRSLCQLVGRLGRGLRLSVEFKALDAQAWWDGDLDFRKHLSMFYEKSLVRPVANEDPL